jgi:hypothetical protein
MRFREVGTCWAPLAAGIATSMVSMAWGQELYQTQSDGSVWQYTGTPCSGGSCTGWMELDNNPNLSMIAAGGGALYEMRNDGSIWWYAGPACSGGSCPGWVELDNNPLNAAIGVGGSNAYEVHQDGSLWEFNGVICNGSSCPGWTELSTNSQQSNDQLYGANAALLVKLPGGFTGDFSLFGGALNDWTGLDTDVSFFAVGANALYDCRKSGAMRQYTGSANWLTIDYTEHTEGIVAGGGLYQIRRNPSTADTALWQYTGVPCSASSCPGWVKIDNHQYAAPVAGLNTVYQFRKPLPGKVSIWQYTGTPCSGSVCSGWVPLDNNPNTTSIVAGPVTFGGI